MTVGTEGGCFVADDCRAFLHDLCQVLCAWHRTIPDMTSVVLELEDLFHE